MPYQKVRFYAFNIKTNPAYQVVPGGPEKEIILRLQALVQAVSKLHALQVKDRSYRDDTLNVLMAPEFYFRPKDGAYDYDTQYRMALQQVFSGFGFRENKHWLIACGTIISKTKSDAPGFWVGFNAALVARGAEQGLKQILKQNFSDIDGMNAYLQGRIQAYFLQNTRVQYYWEKNEPTAFPVDNITLGLEVCLDHSLGVLRQRNIHPQIQLITACGMTIKPENVVATKAVFRVDGQDWDGTGVIQPPAVYKFRSGDDGIQPSTLQTRVRMPADFGRGAPSEIRSLNVDPIKAHDFTDDPGQNFIKRLRRPVRIWEYPSVSYS